MSPRILAIFAHPDDETFLAGGTLAKYAASGWDMLVLCATRGEAGRRGDYENDHLSTEEFALVREREMEAACGVLGVKKPVFLQCADGRIEQDCRESAKAEVLRFLREWKPDAVITFGPDGVSGHSDHVAIGQIATAAVGEADIRSLYYVLHSGLLPTCCDPPAHVPSPSVTTIINVRGYGERKLQAMRCYRSQKHMLPEDPAVIEELLYGVEHFHRALPAGYDGGLEDDLFVPSSATRGLSGFRGRRRSDIGS